MRCIITYGMCFLDPDLWTWYFSDKKKKKKSHLLMYFSSAIPDRNVCSHLPKDSCPGNGHVNQGCSRYLLLQTSYLKTL